MKETKLLIKSYRKLFELTGRPEFFVAMKLTEKTNTPILLDDKSNRLSTGNENERGLIS